ncbi:MAG: hypothetical protein ABIN48_14850 [Ginsengibacter sp.]
MNNKILSGLVFCLALSIFGCSKDNIMSPDLTKSNQTVALKNAEVLALKNAGGAMQISGVGFFPTAGECETLIEGTTYTVKMTGDLQGCLYVFIDDYECSPSGTYREQGREYFVGTYNGKPGTFWTKYKFEGKYEGCAANGAPLGAEIFGRCQHPLVDGSGEGVFKGVTGRIDFKDDIEAGNFPYRGHLKF